jgi:hypothetical protein
VLSVIPKRRLHILTSFVSGAFRLLGTRYAEVLKISLKQSVGRPAWDINGTAMFSSKYSKVGQFWLAACAVVTTNLEAHLV